MSRTSSHCDPEGLFLLNHMPFVSWPRGVFFPGARMKEQPLLGVSGFVTEVKKKQTNKPAEHKMALRHGSGHPSFSYVTFTGI